jgi:hypothetical protein
MRSINAEKIERYWVLPGLREIDEKLAAVKGRARAYANLMEGEPWEFVDKVRSLYGFQPTRNEIVAFFDAFTDMKISIDDDKSRKILMKDCNNITNLIGTLERKYARHAMKITSLLKRASM